MLESFLCLSTCPFASSFVCQSKVNCTFALLQMETRTEKEAAEKQRNVKFYPIFKFPFSKQTNKLSWEKSFTLLNYSFNTFNYKTVNKAQPAASAK